MNKTTIILVAVVLSTLGGCGSNDSGREDDRRSGYAGMIDAEVALTQIECDCLADAEAAAVCYDELDAYSTAERAIAPCMDEALRTLPEGRTVLECWADAFADYPECIDKAGGCAAYEGEAGWACDDEVLEALSACGELPPEVDEAHAMCTEDAGCNPDEPACGT